MAISQYDWDAQFRIGSDNIDNDEEKNSYITINNVMERLNESSN